MHNKFTVIDRLEVWTGSMNYTINEAYFNDNNLIRIRSEQLAENYSTEFEEMFVDDQFRAWLAGKYTSSQPDHCRYTAGKLFFARRRLHGST